MFAIDSKFYRFCEVFFRLVVINLLFLITTFPIVTFGASMNALLRVLKEEEAKIVAPYFHYFKESCLKTAPLVVFNLFSLSFGLLLQQNAVLADLLFLKWLFAVFATFLLTYNLNLYLVQIELNMTKNYFQLFKMAFVFSLGFFYKVVWIPILFGVVYYFLYPYAGLLVNLVFLSAPLFCYQIVFCKTVKADQ